MVAGIDNSISVPEFGWVRTDSLPPAISGRSRRPARPWCPARPPALRTAGSMPAELIGSFISRASVLHRWGLLAVHRLQLAPHRHLPEG